MCVVVCLSLLLFVVDCLLVALLLIVVAYVFLVDRWSLSVLVLVILVCCCGIEIVCCFRCLELRIVAFCFSRVVYCLWFLVCCVCCLLVGVACVRCLLFVVC